jgi:hypothetical protein
MGDVQHERRGRAPDHEHGARELHGRASAGEVAAVLAELPERLGDVTRLP